jgi:hypothetical protein
VSASLNINVKKPKAKEWGYTGHKLAYVILCFDKFRLLRAESVNHVNVAALAGIVEAS